MSELYPARLAPPADREARDAEVPLLMTGVFLGLLLKQPARSAQGQRGGSGGRADGSGAGSRPAHGDERGHSRPIPPRAAQDIADSLEAMAGKA